MYDIYIYIYIYIYTSLSLSFFLFPPPGVYRKPRFLVCPGGPTYGTLQVAIAKEDWIELYITWSDVSRFHWFVILVYKVSGRFSFRPFKRRAKWGSKSHRSLGEGPGILVIYRWCQEIFENLVHYLGPNRENSQGTNLRGFNWYLGIFGGYLEESSPCKNTKEKQCEKHRKTHRKPLFSKDFNPDWRC